MSNRLESIWFTIHNQDTETLRYIWSVGTLYFNTTTLVKVLGKITDHEWTEGMYEIMKSQETIDLCLNLNSDMLEKFFQSLSDQIISQKDYTKPRGYGDYLTLYEDEIDNLKEIVEKQTKEDERDQHFFAQDLIYASGKGNLEVVQQKVEKVEISQLGNIYG